MKILETEAQLAAETIAADLAEKQQMQNILSLYKKEWKGYEG